MAGADEAKTRRILDLEVKEVSIVDRPAIMRRFLITKRLEESTMTAFENDDKVEKKAKAKPEDEMSEEEKAKAKAEAEAEAEKEDEEKKKAKAKPEDEEEKSEEEKKKAVNPAALAGMLRGLKGAPGGALKELLGWLESQAGKKKQKPDEEEEETGDDMKSKTKKSEDGGESEGVMLVIKNDGSINIMDKEVAKRRQFTSGRTKTLTSAVLELANLVKEVDEEAAKTIASALKEFPNNAKVDSKVRPVAAKKSEDGDDDEKSELRKQVADLTKRLEDIEKTRAPSKSLDGEGGTEEKVEKKSGLWSGVL